MGITVDIQSGLHTGTKTENGKLVLLPTPVAPMFPGDDSEWDLKQSAAAWETVDTDKLRNLNTNDTYLQATISIEQETAVPITFRVKASGSGLSGGDSVSRFGIRIRGYDSDGISGGNLLGEDEEAFPMGDWPDSQFEITFTPTAPVYWLYAYIFTRNQPGTVTVWDAEIWDTAQEDREYGVWYSHAIDRKLTIEDTASAGTGLDPRIMGFYYGYLYKLDELYSVVHSTDLLSNMDDIVVQEPGASQFNTGDVNEDRAKAVLQALLDSGMRVWGYTYMSGDHDTEYDPIGGTGIEVFEDMINRCAAETPPYYGIFIDEAGWSSSRPNNNRVKFNAIVDYAHAAGLKVWANSTEPPDVLSASVDATYNPGGTATSLAAGDWILLESMWTRSDEYYSGETGSGSWTFAQYVERWLDGVTDAHDLSVSVAALSFPLTTRTSLDDYSDWNAAYLFAVACGVDGWFGSGTGSSDYHHWLGRPDIKVGDTLVSSVALDDVSAGLWLAETDAGILQFTVTENPTVRTGSIGIFTGSLSPLNKNVVIPTDEQRATHIWEVSNDKLTWTELSSNNTLYRYARRKVIIES